MKATISLLALFFISGFYLNLPAQWVQTNGPNVDYVICLASSGTNVFAGTYHQGNGGFYRSGDNGQSWTFINSAFVSSLLVVGTTIYAGDIQGVLISTDEFTNWTYHTNGLTYTSSIVSFAFSGTNLFAADYMFGVYFSTNDGANWTAVNNGFPNGLYYSSLAVLGTNIFVGTSGGVYRSSNNGTNWTLITDGLTEIRCLAISGTNLFAGSSWAGVYRSSDNGTNWAEVNEGLTSISAYCFTVVEANIFVGTDAGVFFSTNDGTNWSDFNSGLPNYIASLAVSGENLFAGVDGSGVWRRPLSDILPVELSSFSAKALGDQVKLNWKTESEVSNYGFEIERSSSLGSENKIWQKIGFVEGNGNSSSPKEYSFTDNKLIGGTKFQYRLKQIDNDGQFEYSNVIEVENIPTEYALYQNYPNPFNPVTKIKYSVPQTSKVVVKVFDILGNEIATLMDEEKQVGTYELTWNAANLPSGVYFYRLQAGDFVQTRKMVLLK